MKFQSTSTTPFLLALSSFLSFTSAKCSKHVCFTTRPSQENCDSTSECTFSTLNAWGPHNRSMPDSNIDAWLIDINATYNVEWQMEDNTYPVRLAWHFYDEEGGMGKDGMMKAPIRWSRNTTKGRKTLLNFTEILLEDFPNDDSNLTTREALSLATYYGENFLTVSQPSHPDFQRDNNRDADLQDFDLSARFIPQASVASAYPQAAWNRARRYYRAQGQKKVALAAGLGVGLGIPLTALVCTTLGYLWGKREMRRWMENKVKEEGGMLPGEEVVTEGGRVTDRGTD